MLLIDVKVRPGSQEGELAVIDHTNACVAGPWPCAIGRGSLTETKVEGDGATPVGVFALLYVWWRPDRVEAQDTALPRREITDKDGWCDDPKHPAYNQPVTLPFDASHEVMARDDHAYDICVVLDYNIDPIIPGRGSAIFFHCTKGGDDVLTPTAGCVSVPEPAMREVLQLAIPGTTMRVRAV